jgi:hypothetical protein
MYVSFLFYHIFSLISDYFFTTVTFYAYDQVKTLDDDEPVLDHPIATADYLALLRHPGVPNHELELKEGAICVLIRNLSIAKGLVKNARVVIKSLRRNYVEVTLLSKNRFTPHIQNYCIPRITFEFRPHNANFSIYRKQFPLRLAYATTFNSCQGLTLDRVVLDLRTEVFAHGQLYTALTRVRSQSDAKILVANGLQTTTTNSVYQQLLL